MLEADYSVALSLMLRYPTPPPPHGPHTFVDDAMYLKGHFDAAGGVALISKYTGKSPASTPAPTPVPSTTPTPSFHKFSSFRQRTLGPKSPLSSARILQHPGGVEALLQGAAKNVREKGEKLGITQAVRDAMGEIRRNVQGFQEARNSTRGSRRLSVSNGSSPLTHALTITLMERRNRRLASMLEESIIELQLLTAPDTQKDRAAQIQTVEVATARIQFVKACLEDPSLILSEEEAPSLTTLSMSSGSETGSPTVALDTTPVVTSSSAVEETRTAPSSPASGKENGSVPSPREDSAPKQAADDPDKVDTDVPDKDTIPPLKSDSDSESVASAAVAKPPDSASPTEKRPNGPIPTRSTLAQSSFAWMLEPDTTSSSSSNSSHPTSKPSTGGSGAQKKHHDPSRERNAFLFGEVTAQGGDGKTPSEDHIFGLQPIRNDN